MMNPPFFLPAAINHLLAAEPWAQARLAAHAGKVVRIDAGMVELVFRIAGDGLLTAVGGDTSPAPNVTIRMQMSDLPMMARDRERAFSYVQVEGDAEFAATIAQVAQSVRWEAEEDLSRLVGDIAARRLVQTGKSLVEAVQTTHRKLSENLAEYFLEENPMLVRPASVEDFASEVVKLRDDMERLAKRIDRLQEKSSREET